MKQQNPVRDACAEFVVSNQNVAIVDEATYNTVVNAAAGGTFPPDIETTIRNGSRSYTVSGRTPTRAPIIA